MKLAVGQEVYACNCGAKCPCDTLSMNPGKCTCGVDMVKATVQPVGDGTAVLLVSGPFKQYQLSDWLNERRAACQSFKVTASAW